MYFFRQQPRVSRDRGSLPPSPLAEERFAVEVQLARRDRAKAAVRIPGRGSLLQDRVGPFPLLSRRARLARATLIRIAPGAEPETLESLSA